MFQRPNLAAGLAAGALSGLAASWLMLRFIQGPGTALLNALKTETDRAEDAAESQARALTGHPPDTVTVQAADLLANRLLIHRHLSQKEKERAGTAVHYTFGLAMGVAYGIAAEYTTLPGLGFGTAFGTLLWAATDLWSVPATGFAKPPTQEPPAAHLTHLLSHLVYGVGMEATRRLLRW